MEQGPVTCRGVAAAYARGATAPLVLDVRLGRTAVRVRSNAATLMDALAAHYADFPGDAGAPDIEVTVLDCGPVPLTLPFAMGEGADDDAKEEFVDLPDGRVVRKRRTGLWLVFGRGGHYVLGPCADNVDQVVNGINARAADRELRDGALLLHAAGVAVGGAGLAISGFAGAGKSTLALEIMRHGASFASNDRLLVGPAAPGNGLVMTGIARMPRVNPGTLLHNDNLAALLTEEERAGYARLKGDALWALERKYDVPIRDCFGSGRFRLRAALAALVVLRWRPGQGGMATRWVESDARAELLPAFMKDLGVFFEAGPRRAAPEAYLRLLGDCPVLLVEGGTDFPRAAALCLDLLTQQPVATSVA
ncbi:MAG TPA: HprK-related kinase B [Solidesulfovibrio sp.]|nr:HprK-related kinase B [Desulfovibrio sp.]HML60626.1 HprK-related kinase B [Solidesulfovibrio sp.]